METIQVKRHVAAQLEKTGVFLRQDRLVAPLKGVIATMAELTKSWITIQDRALNILFITF
jgi:hypothetical protein